MPVSARKTEMFRSRRRRRLRPTKTTTHDPRPTTHEALASAGARRSPTEGKGEDQPTDQRLFGHGPPTHQKRAQHEGQPRPGPKSASQKTSRSPTKGRARTSRPTSACLATGHRPHIGVFVSAASGAEPCRSPTRGRARTSRPTSVCLATGHRPTKSVHNTRASPGPGQSRPAKSSVQLDYVLVSGLIFTSDLLAIEGFRSPHAGIPEVAGDILVNVER